jgi:hypothetical protein
MNINAQITLWTSHQKVWKSQFHVNITKSDNYTINRQHNTQQQIENGVRTTISTMTNPDGSTTTVRETVDRNGNTSRVVNTNSNVSSFSFPNQNISINFNNNNNRLGNFNNMYINLTLGCQISIPE